MFNTLKDCVPGLSRRFERLSDETGQYISDAAEMSGYSFQNLVNDPNRAPNRLEQQIGRAHHAIMGTFQPWAQNVGNRLVAIINARIAAGSRRNGNNAPPQPYQPLPTEPPPAEQQQSDRDPSDVGNNDNFDLTSLLSSESPFDSLPSAISWNEADDDFNDDFDDEPSELDISANEHDYMLTEQSLSRLLGFATFVDGSYMHSSVEEYVLNVDDQNNYASADFASVAENNVVEGNNVVNSIVKSIAENDVASSSASRQPAHTPCVSPPRPQMKKRACSQASTEVDSHAGSNELTQCPSIYSLGSAFTLVNESDADSDEEDHYIVI